MVELVKFLTLTHIAGNPRDAPLVSISGEMGENMGETKRESLKGNEQLQPTCGAHIPELEYN